MKRPKPRKRDADRVERWNAEHAVGTLVDVRRDDQTVLRTTTRAKAELLGGHMPVVWVVGISGCYALDRVTPVREAAG